MMPDKCQAFFWDRLACFWGLSGLFFFRSSDMFCGSHAYFCGVESAHNEVRWRDPRFFLLLFSRFQRNYRGHHSDNANQCITWWSQHWEGLLSIGQV